MAKVVTIYWRDIPSQVTVQEGRKRAKKLLPDRFQQAIDRAAMRAKKTDADAYLNDWHRDSRNLQGEIDDLVNTIANDLDLNFHQEKLEEMVRNKGLMPESAGDT